MRSTTERVTYTLFGLRLSRASWSHFERQLAPSSFSHSSEDYARSNTRSNYSIFASTDRLNIRTQLLDKQRSIYLLASSESLIWRTRLRNRPERPKDRSHDCIQRETRVDSDKWDVYIVANPTNPAVTRQDSSQRPDRISYRTDNPSIEKVIIDHFASHLDR